MNFRFTIGRKIGLGFGIILVLFIVASWFTNFTLSGSRATTEEVTHIYNPSVAKLKELKDLLIRSNLLITKWFYFQSSDDDPNKVKLRKLINIEYPELKTSILNLSPYWNKSDQLYLNDIISKIDRLFTKYQYEIMKPLNSFSVYDDGYTKMMVQLPYEDCEDKSTIINTYLDELIKKESTTASDNSNLMLQSFSTLQSLIIWLGIIVVLGGTLISFFTVRTIVRPIKQLKKILLMMGKGVLPNERIKDRQDEIGEMSIALNGLVDGMARTTEFAREVGAGNFVSYYQPLSDEDTLGAALLKMREDLSENEKVLEAKVVERTEQVVRQKEEIETQNQELEVLYKHVTDSIKYAKRIQEAILPPDSMVKKMLPNAFVLYKPKDIVSGDFYWMDEKDDKTMFAAVDCTGHGVPGAFMSIVGYNLLKHVVNENDFTTPSLILDELNDGVSETLHHGHEEAQAKDGMDIAFCTINFKTLELEYAGAYNPLYIIRNNELIQTKADKFPIGLFVGEKKRKFQNHTIQLQKGDSLYIFSDGYADQFGGPNGRKFMANQFREILMEVHQKPVATQKEILNKTIENWRGSLDQVDDILVIGLQIA